MLSLSLALFYSYSLTSIVCVVNFSIVGFPRFNLESFCASFFVSSKRDFCYLFTLKSSLISFFLSISQSFILTLLIVCVCGWFCIHYRFTTFVLLCWLGWTVSRYLLLFAWIMHFTFVTARCYDDEEQRRRTTSQLFLSK